MSMNSVFVLKRKGGVKFGLDSHDSSSLPTLTCYCERVAAPHAGVSVRCRDSHLEVRPGAVRFLPPGERKMTFIFSGSEREKLDEVAYKQAHERLSQLVGRRGQRARTRVRTNQR